jgi:ubiquinone/menaquinone biosynthesis C-methylase UbiE
MLQSAIDIEKSYPLGIEYKLSDITSLPYEDNIFDKIACIAVLIHDSPQECKQFFKEAHRTLKPEGRLVVSIMHPHLYQFGSPNRRGLASWAKYTNLEAQSMDVSQRFKEDYKNSNGEIFSSTVWYHPESFLIESIKEAGLAIGKTQSTYITKEVLEACNQTGPVGYPCFWQAVARKGK